MRKIRYGTGCTVCGGTGYKGRIAVHEILVIDKELRSMITKGASSEDMFAYAVRTQNFRTWKEELVQLVEDGIVSSDELIRLCR